MTKYLEILFLLLFIIQSNLIKSQNLIPNPSFEYYNVCPNSWGQISSCQNWSSFGGDPDYLNECTPYQPPTGNYFGVPNNVEGFQYPHSGIAYVGTVEYLRPCENCREYIGTQLLSPLIVSQKYFISFYVNLGGRNRAMIATNKMGVKFSTAPFSILNPAPINNTAHFYTNDIITDTINWTKLSGSFIADSSYNYFILGNFFDDSNTDTINFAPYAFWSYYFIDDICLSTDSLYCENWNNINNINNKNNFSIQPNPTHDKFSIDLLSNNKEEITVNIITITGQNIFSNKYYNQNLVEVNVSTLAKGVYSIEILYEKGIEYKKLIIQ